MSDKLNTLFMAFATGSSSEESRELGIGVASVWIKGVCPSKQQLEEFYGRPQEKDPQYIDEVEIDGQKVRRARIDVLIETDPEYNNGLSLKNRVSYYLTEKEVRSKDNKIQIIDKFGRTAWATEEEINQHTTMLTKKDGSKYQAMIDEDYWVARRGEADLVNTIKAFCRIKEVVKWDNGQAAGFISDVSEAYAYLEEVDKIFKGDFTQIEEAIGHQPTNKFKLGFGVKTDDNNKQYQAFFLAYPMKNGTTNYETFAKRVAEAQANGAYPNTEFEACTLKKYVNTPSAAPVSQAPASAPTNWFKKN